VQWTRTARAQPGVSRERRAVATDMHVMGAPDLVIEIVSARSAESLALHGGLARLGRASLSGEPHARLKASRYTAASRDSVGRAFQASRTLG